MMTYTEAKALFKPKNFPFGFRYENESFVVNDMEVSRLLPSCQRPEILKNYKLKFLNSIHIEPIWCSVGRKLKSGEVNKYQHHHVHIEDGNHRSQAAKDLGIKFIKAIMPESHWRAYENN
jgi:hypothetical protein